MANYSLIVDFEVKDGMMEQFLPVMKENARASVANEPGCLQFDVLQVQGEPNRVVLFEVYQDEAAFQAHMKMPHLAAFLEKARPMMGKPTMTKMDRAATNKR